MNNEQWRKSFVCFCFLLTAVCMGVYSQERQQAAYMIPPKVYVGDRASLIVPLTGFSGGGDIELPAGAFPVSADIDFHRIAAERRPGGRRLVIEFSAFAPGFLEVPPFEISGQTFRGLRIEILSILGNDASATILSGPASSLAIPGTGILIYGTLSVVILLMILSLFVLLRGRKLIMGLLAVWRRKRLIATMRRIEKNLRKAMVKDTDLREILNKLSTEFRSFFSFLTGENCRAMTAGEIGRLMSRFVAQPTLQPVRQAVQHAVSQFTRQTEGGGIYDGPFLEDFFSRCDGFRFSGGKINDGETLVLLDDLRSYLQALGTTERKPKRSEEAA
jgi:hypothetical protein